MADAKQVIWLETWDLTHPQCPWVPTKPCDGNLFMVSKAMPREQYELMFGEVRDKRVH
jgi:hypothetical protein